MNENFYYDGRQIKNYLIGFASIFSEIPYQDRKGIIRNVPIHYGSPSDIISYLEMNVDNEDTHNRNRLKDVTVPLFSFRMTSMERNVERRRAPLDTITVDLRSLGYSTGYVAMKPAPFKFNFELLLWASSDYQAFEITEQIVPYFNSSQQVTIEPLPKCPVSTSEVFLESLEIDTEPDSQKYSALVTMTFSLTGWLLSQPRIWSTNMKFELSMLDKENLNNNSNYNDEDYSVGHEIIDNNSRPKPKTDKELSLETINNFITRTPLAKIYGDKFDWYNELVLAGRIDPNTGQIINTEDLIIDWKGTEKTLDLSIMEMLVDDMEDVKYLFENEKLKFALSSHTLKDDIYVIGEMYEDVTDTIEIYLTLLDNNLVTKGFNRTSTPISNSDKLNMFGTTRVDIETVMDRMRTYLAGVENIKVKKDIIQEIDGMNERYSIMLFDIHLPLSEIPVEFKEQQDIMIDYNKVREFDYIVDSYDEKNQKLKLKVIIPENQDSLDSKPNSIILVYQFQDMIKADEINIEYNQDGSFFIEIPMVVGYIRGFNIITKAYSDNQDDIISSFNIKGVYIQDNSDITTRFNKGKKIFNNTRIPNKNIEVTDEYSGLFDENMVLNDRFINLNNYVITTLLYTRIISKIGILTNDDGYKLDDEDSELKKEQIEKDPFVKIYLNKFNKTIDDLLNYRHGLRKTFMILNKSISEKI